MKIFYVISTNNHDFRDPYAFYRDGIFPSVNRYELFKYFYNNRFEKIPIYNLWRNYLEKLLFPEGFEDVDLVKALIKSYNLETKSFHKNYGRILCMLDLTSFIEVCGLEGHMSVPLEIDELKGNFERNMNSYTRKTMIQQTPMDLKKVGDYPKKVDKMMALNKSKNYF